MADTFTNIARLRLQEVGANEDTWGDLLNITIQNIEELAIGSDSIVIAGDYTLPVITDGASSLARKLVLTLTGSPVGPFTFTVPTGLIKPFVIINDTGEDADVRQATQSPGVIVPDGTRVLLLALGTEVVSVQADAAGAVSLATNSAQLGGVAAAEYARLAVHQDWTRGQAVNFVNSGDVTGSVSLNAEQSNNFRLRLTGNITLTLPTNLKNGQTLNLLLVQDAAGNKTLTLSGNWRTPGGSQFVLSTAANAVDLLSAVFWDGFLYVNIVKGFATV